jgi:hypothetical protein
MKRALFLFIICAAIFMQKNSYARGWYPGKVETIPGTLMKHKGIGLDLQTEFGVGLVDVQTLSERFFLRQRIGILCFYEPWFFSFGATVEGLGLPQFAGGVETEVTNLYFGGWLQFGASVGKERNYLHAGLGWSVFGVEWQNQILGTEHANALLVKIRAPLGIILMGTQMK